MRNRDVFLREQTHKINVLLIESNSDDANLVKQYLQEATNDVEIELFHLDHLSKGLDVLAAHNIDIVLWGVTFSTEKDISDESHLQIIQKVAPNVPIILLLQKFQEGWERSLKRKGIQDYLLKGHFDRYMLIRSIRYILERQEMLAQLEKARQLEKYLSYYDALTGLPNRELFYERLQQAVLKMDREEAQLGVLFLDLDSFKRINDSLGYRIGDQLLKAISRRLTTCLNEKEHIFRVGGDEFTIILNHVEDEQDIAAVARNLLKAIAEPIVVKRQEHYITASVGIAIFPGDGNDSEILFRNAEIAMCRVKNYGRNNYQFYEFSMEASILEKLEMENSLRSAIHRKEMLLYYQPVVDLKSGEIVSVEALVRWNDSRYGLIPPAKFIPVAEESGLIVSLGEWILETACKQNKALQDAGYKPVRVSVNLSARQFLENDMQKQIERILRVHQLDPRFLGLEITETSAMKDLDYTIETLNEFKKIGVEAAIDDFGTGYSSLNYLKRLPVRILKIDRSFIEGIPDDRENMMIVRAIINLGHSLNMKVIAEGVEKKEQIDILRINKCDQIQGFYFSRPLPFEKLADLLAASRNVDWENRNYLITR